MARTETGASRQYAEAVMGTWKADLKASKFSPGPAPKSHTRRYEPSGDGYKLTVEAVDDAGNQSSWAYTANYDGKDYPVTGSPAVDTISLSKINDHHTLGIFKKGGVAIALYNRGISLDGKTLTITTAGTNENNNPYFDVTVYHK
jgi:hypothetical protein